MKDSGKKAIKHKITKEISITEKDIASLIELTAPISPENAIGRISRMDAINNKSVNEASLRQTQQKLIKLQHALERIEESDFGVCTQCKQPIPIGRIMLMPQAVRCVNCT